MQQHLFSGVSDSVTSPSTLCHRSRELRPFRFAKRQWGGGPFAFVLGSLLLSSTHLYGAAATATSLQVSGSFFTAGQVAVLTAKVNTGTTTIETGQVVFEEDKTGSSCVLSTRSIPGCATLGLAQLTTSGQATLSLRFGPGQHYLTARFLTNTAYEASMASEQEITVTGATAEVAVQPREKNGTLTGLLLANSTLAPTGSIEFLDQMQRTVLGTANLEKVTSALSFGPQLTYSTAASSPFSSCTNLGASRSPAASVAGDFNGDGIADLAVANNIGCQIAVFIGKADGTFQPAAFYHAGARPFSIAMGDFNSDGKLDLVTANNYDGTVTVLLGNGDGTFGPPAAITLQGAPYGVVVADFNKDGVADISVACDVNTSIQIIILFGNNDGSFTQSAPYPVASQVSVGAGGIAVGDLTGSGTLDVVTVQPSANEVFVLNGQLSQGNGNSQNYSLGSAAGYSVGEMPFSVALADLNGDGILDLATTNYLSGSVSVLLGESDGTFDSATSYTVGTHPTSIVIGDLNNDGSPDLVTANAASGNVSVLLGTGGGLFRSQTVYSTGSDPAAVTLGNFSGSGLSELAVMNYGDSTVGILPNLLTQKATVKLTGQPNLGGESVIVYYSGDAFYSPAQSEPIIIF